PLRRSPPRDAAHPRGSAHDRRAARRAGPSAAVPARGRAAGGQALTGGEDMTLELSPDGTALLIIDMMNDHIHSDGTASRYFGGLTPEQRELIVGNNRRLLEAARAKGLPVVHVRGENRWDTLDSATAE